MNVISRTGLISPSRACGNYRKETAVGVPMCVCAIYGKAEL